MAITEDEQNAIDRAAQYSPTVYVEGSNDYGLRGDGYLTNFPRGLNDLATVAGAVARLAADVIAKAADVVTKWGVVVAKADEVAALVTTAADQAIIASNKAGEAVASATTASDKATIATNKAGEAVASATTASDKATIATTKAGEATASATTAGDKATIATNKAGEAAASATVAGDKATIATNKAAEAVAAAAAAATWDPASYLAKAGGTLTGWLQTAAGNSGALGLHIGELGSGFYRSGVGIVGFVAAGVEVFRTAATGVMTFDKAVVPKTITMPWASSITVDLTQGNKFSVTLGGATTFANPALTAAMIGQEFIIVPTQDGAGNRTVACGSYFRFPNGTAPTASTAAGKRDRILCEVVSVAAIDAVYVKGF